MFLDRSQFPDHQWADWRFHMTNLIRSRDALSRWVRLTPAEEDAIDAVNGTYLWMATPYYASLMDKYDDACPIRRQTIPHLDEMRRPVTSHVDPVGDMLNLKTRRIVHKYPNRVVMLVSDTCPVYCRHCTRKFHTTDVSGTYYKDGDQKGYEADFDYIRRNSMIDDVLLTGGDPLTLTDNKLEHIVSELRKIPHVNIIRIGSRYPVFLPQRITPEFCALLEKYHPVWLSTHFNHPVEVTEEAAEACDRLLRHGIPVQNQTVLLKGINDDAEVMRQLFKKLVGIRVRPYYLYHCDNVTGVSHFATSVETGAAIMESLTGFETGFSVPTYVLTTKIGKIPIQRSYFESVDGWPYVRNYKHEVEDAVPYISPTIPT
ncbi:arginine 2,3-aminomutase (plasmid) [Azospirillum argentinense]|uniref:Arginine 2,3-aminomutase n=1 Tax=Azospirillum argentinense TaxID=2970906 RepID=A0A4D8PP53_9PROT|nr:arginine 2,3-aminomutase [Azospirillum argentinense]QCO00274.1 arginine 2,3-aminomutase [Azospirillum argentinense]